MVFIGGVAHGEIGALKEIVALHSQEAGLLDIEELFLATIVRFSGKSKPLYFL